MSEQSAPGGNNATANWVALGMIVLGFGVTALNWYVLEHDGSYYVSAALVAPFIGFIGLAMIVAPNAPVNDGGPVTKPPSLRRQMAIGLIGLGVLASIADFVLINGWI